MPDGSIRRRMEPHRASPARCQRLWTAKGPQSPRDPKRHLLPTEEWMPVAAWAVKTGANDGRKKVKGRKRHLLVDTEGFVLRAKEDVVVEWLKLLPPKASWCSQGGG
jgi:hypothetical protein